MKMVISIILPSFRSATICATFECDGDEACVFEAMTRPAILLMALASRWLWGACYGAGKFQPETCGHRGDGYCRLFPSNGIR
jgi:hypothetical protein